MVKLLSRQEVEKILERIQTHKGVLGVIIVSPDSIPLRSTMDNPTTLQYIGMCNTLCGLASGVIRDTDPQNDLTILRVRTKKHEVIMAPEKGQYLIVIQSAEDYLQNPIKNILD